MAVRIGLGLMNPAIALKLMAVCIRVPVLVAIDAWQL
jgi:hypothetical protein